MILSGMISEFSLPVIFQIIEQTKKTGRLTVKQYPYLEDRPSFHIWFMYGKIVAAADRLDGHGLLSKIQEQGWISIRAAARISMVCASNKPVGSSLKDQGLLDSQQLQKLFKYQVLQPIYELLNLDEGGFEFDSKTILPNLEMTGLTASPHEVILMGKNQKTDISNYQISLKIRDKITV